MCYIAMRSKDSNFFWVWEGYFFCGFSVFDMRSDYAVLASLELVMLTTLPLNWEISSLLPLER